MAGERQHDPDELLWGLALLVAIVFIAWWYAGEQVMALLLRLKVGQLGLQNGLGLGNAHTQQLQEAVIHALNNPHNLTFEQLIVALNHVGYYWRWPVMVLLLGVALWIGFFNSTERFRKQMDLHRLAEAMGEHWPFALHALRRNQLAIPLDDPQWGMALDQWRFVQHHELLIPHPPDARPEEVGHQLDRQRAHRILVEQLGASNQRIDALPAHVHALAGLFAQRRVSLTTDSDQQSAQLKHASYDGLRRLAWAAANNKDNDYLPSAADFKIIIAQTQACWENAEVKAVIAVHAYQNTLLMRLLEEARRNGILATSLFTWLKGLDRPLWYALNNVGRREPFVEAVGPFTHYQAERQVGRRLDHAFIEPALDGLEAALAHSHPPPHLDLTRSFSETSHHA